MQTMQALGFAQADQDLHCPLPESMDIIVYVNKVCPDQTAWMCMLIWTLAVCLWQKDLFPILYIMYQSPKYNVWIPSFTIG